MENLDILENFPDILIYVFYMNDDYMPTYSMRQSRIIDHILDNKINSVTLILKIRSFTVSTIVFVYENI